VSALGLSALHHQGQVFCVIFSTRLAKLIFLQKQAHSVLKLTEAYLFCMNLVKLIDQATPVFLKMSGSLFA
jgi:hypothetical protein